MSGQPQAVRIAGLTKAQLAELGEYVDEESLAAEVDRTPEGTMGEIALATAAVIASAVAIRGLIAYLVYRHRGESFEETVEVVMSDGSRVKKVLRWRDTSREPPNVALAKELGSTLGLDPSTLAGNP